MAILIPQQAIHAGSTPHRAWASQVNRLADALVDAGSMAELQACLSSDVTIRQFTRSEPDSPSMLHLATRNAVTITVRAYTLVPQTLASDLSDDFANALGMPESLRRPMLVADGEPARRANLTGAKWVASLLEPRATSATAVIVLWHASAEESAPNPPLLLLIRGHEISAGEWRIDQIIYGDLTQALRTGS
jgi:hypothetical protein